MIGFMGLVHLCTMLSEGRTAMTMGSSLLPLSLTVQVLVVSAPSVIRWYFSISTIRGSASSVRK